MAILAKIKIDAGIIMPVYVRIINVSEVTNHYNGGKSLVVVRGFLKSLLDSGDYTDFHGDNPPPYCWGGEQGVCYEVDIDPSAKIGLYDQAYNEIMSDNSFLSVAGDPTHI